MLQLSEKTESSLVKSIDSISKSVPKLSKVLDLEKSKETGVWSIEPKKIYITINDPVTIEAPKMITDGKEKEKEEGDVLKATKSESATALKIKEKWKKEEEKEKKWKNNVKKWQENMLSSTKKALTDNPIVNFIKDHWGKLLIGLTLFFLKPEQMKKVWEALKGMASWLWKNKSKIFDGIVTVLKTIGSAIGGLVDWFLGKTDKERAQEEYDEMKKDGKHFWESQEAFEKRLEKQKEKIKAADDTTLKGGVFGEDASIFKQVTTGLVGLTLALKKVGPDGLLGKLASKPGKGLFNKLIRNDVMEEEAKKYLTPEMMEMDRGRKPTMMDKFRDNIYVKYGKKKASRVGEAVKTGASRVGGAVKSMASTGGDWFKSLMEKFGKAGKFLTKMGKNIVQGLMTMGPYGWGILAGIALGGLVWYFWDDVTKVWDKVAGAIKDGFNKILEFASSIVGSARSMLGNFLRSVGAEMIADWIDPDGADKKKPKKEFTWGGFAEELWNVYSGIWKAIIGRVKKLGSSIGSLVLKFAKAVGVPDWITDMFDTSDEPPKKPFKFSMTKEEMDATPGLQEKAQTQWSSFEKTEEGKEYLRNFKDPKTGKVGVTSSKSRERARKAWEAKNPSRSAVSTPSKVTATRGTERAQKKIEEVRNIKSTKERNKKIKNILKGPDGEEFWEAMSPKEKERHRGVAWLGGVITKEQALSMQPNVSPMMKANTLNQVQSENAELSSGGNAVVAPTVINNYYNSSGGENGTAIYGVPTAQKGQQHRHSNIR